MPDAPDILADYPELKFSRERATVLPSEIAEKWECTTEHVFEFVDRGELKILNLTGHGNKSSRQCIRIPVSSYYAVTRDRLRDDWRPPHYPNPKQAELF